MQVLLTTQRDGGGLASATLRFQKGSGGNFISWKETLLGVLLLTVSFLALNWIVAQAAPAPHRETPASWSANNA